MKLNSLLLAAALLSSCVVAHAQVILAQQGVATTITLPDMVGTDHLSGLTGQTGTVYLSRIANATGTVTKAASTNSITEIDSTNEPGQYVLTLTAAETGTVGYIKGYYKSSTSDPIGFTVRIVPWNPDSAANLGLTALPSAAPGTAGGLGDFNTASSTNTNTGTLIARPAPTGDVYGLLSPLIVSGKYTASALSNAPTGGGGGGSVDLSGIPAAVWGYTGGRTITGGTIGTYTGNVPQSGDAFLRLGSPVGADLAHDIAAVQAGTAANGAAISGVPAAVASYNVGGSAGTLSSRVAQAISASIQGGSYLSGAVNTTAHTQPVTYYLPGTTLAAMNAGTATVIDTALITLDSTNTKTLSRVDTPGTF